MCQVKMYIKFLGYNLKARDHWEGSGVLVRKLKSIVGLALEQGAFH